MIVKRPWLQRLWHYLTGKPTHDLVYCDRCFQLVVGGSPPSGSECCTAGYYHGWIGYTNLGESDVCDSCMWDDPRYIADFGLIKANVRDPVLKAIAQHHGIQNV